MYLNDSKTCDNIPLPRVDYVVHNTESVELHGFANSSKDARTTVVYIRYTLH